MKPRGILTEQAVSAVKLERARDLRRSQTHEESMLWAALRRGTWSGPKFRRQQVIDGFIADFYCHAAALVVEVDGPIHARQSAYDQERDRVIAAHGLRLLRVTNQDVRQRLPDVLAHIRAACRLASPLPPRLGEGVGDEGE